MYYACENVNICTNSETDTGEQLVNDDSVYFGFFCNKLLIYDLWNPWSAKLNIIATCMCHPLTRTHN